MNKRAFTLLCCLFSFVAISLSPIACKSPKLEAGGAYSPANGQPDVAFYQVDAAFDLAYSAMNGVFQFEQDNRATLWQLSPQIKKTLDSIRPDAAKAVQEYGIARKAYLASPSTAGLTTLQGLLQKAQQLTQAAQAVTADLGTTLNKGK